MKNKKEKEKNKDKILNQIPIFLAKTYRIVDVLSMLWRILPMQTPSHGFLNKMDLLSRVLPTSPRPYSQSISSIRIMHRLLGSWISMDFIKSDQMIRAIFSHIITFKKMIRKYMSYHRSMLPLIKRKNSSTQQEPVEKT